MDVLVNNAGYGYRSAVEEGEDEAVAPLGITATVVEPGAFRTASPSRTTPRRPAGDARTTTPCTGPSPAIPPRPPPTSTPSQVLLLVDDGRMTILRSLLLFALAAVAEIGGAWLVWQGVREHRGWLWAGAGVIALGAYGFVATLQPDAHFGRILAAYGGVFVAGSLVWAMVVDGFRPDRFDVIGALVCLAGVALIMYAPRSA